MNFEKNFYLIFLNLETEEVKYTLSVLGHLIVSEAFSHCFRLAAASGVEPATFASIGRISTQNASRTKNISLIETTNWVTPNNLKYMSPDKALDTPGSVICPTFFTYTICSILFSFNS